MMTVTARALVLLLLGASPAAALGQFFAKCGSGDRGELAENVRAHAQHTYRLDRKVSEYWYHNKKLPPEYEDAKLEDVERFLRRSKERMGVLYHAHDRASPKYCTWLATRRGVTSHVETGVSKEEHDGLRDGLFGALRVPERMRGRAPTLRGAALLAKAEVPAADGEAALKRLSERLLPTPVVRAILEQGVETLVVVPHGDEGTIPFAALHMGESGGKPRLLVDVASVLMAPGFESFKKAPTPRRSALVPAIVVGDPASTAQDKDYDFPQLAGARAEAAEVARLLLGDGSGHSSANLLVVLEGGAATSEAVLDAAGRLGGTPQLLYLSTHGVADPVDPLDGSFLWLADGRWSARQFQKFPARDAQPLVVLSACQTGLGKRFDVGTIGMARSWQLAGARSVVMSLWRVDDDATRKLMVRFLAEAMRQPPDKALRAAMLARKAEDADPAHWSSFAVFGVPER